MAERVLMILAVLSGATGLIMKPPDLQYSAIEETSPGNERVSVMGTLFFNQVGLAQMIEKQGNITEAVSDGMLRLEEALANHLKQDSTFSGEVAAMRSHVENLTSVIRSYIDKGESAIARENITGHILVKARDQEVKIRKLEDDISEVKAENQQLQEEKKMLREENSQLRIDVHQTEEDVRKVREDIRQVQEDKRKVEEDKRKIEEDKRKIEEDKRKVEEDKRKVEEDNRKIEEDKRRIEEDKRKVEEDNRLLQDQVRELREESRRRENETETLLQEENESLQTIIGVLEEEKEALEEKMSAEAEATCVSNTSEVRRLEAEISALEEENGKLKAMLKSEMRPANCEAHFCKGVLKDGVYEVFPVKNEGAVSAWCDMSASRGGWTVFLKRQQQDHQEDFARPWEEYREGFGSIDAEYWLGLETLHKMTSAAPMTLRLEAMAFDGESRWAEWNTFSVAGSDTQYALTVGNYSSNSTLGDPLTFSRNISGMAFSTLDRDNDKLSLGLSSSTDCVEYYSSGGGWWYASCSDIKPTAPLTSSGRLNTLMTMWWTTSFPQWTSLKEVKFMFRPQERSEFCM